MRPLLICLALLSATGSTLVACAKAPEAAQDIHKVTFLCDGGHTLEVVFSGDSAQVLGPDFNARLTQQPSGSGIHYAGDGYDLRGKGPQMTWTAPASASVACREQQWAMQQPQIQPTPTTLAGSKWQLVHQSSGQGTPVRIPPALDRYSLEFASDGAYFMQLDCNRLSGNWQGAPEGSAAGPLTLSGGAMTRAMCQQGAMDTTIAADTAQVRRYVIEGDTLRLILDNGAGEYVWRRVVRP